MTRSVIRIAALALALAAIAAPTAAARPADVPLGHAKRLAGSGGFPQRPVIDRPSAPPSAQPVAVPAAAPAPGADHGVDWTTVGLGAGAGLLAVGAAVTGVSRGRRTGRARAAA